MRTVRVLAGAATAVVLAGCGASARAGEDQAAPRPLPPGQHAEVRVGLTEWTIVVSRSRVPPGRLSLLVTNAGATVHDLVVRSSLGTWETAELQPGRQTGLVVRARPHDVLQLWCSMPGHRAQGMHTTLTTS